MGKILQVHGISKQYGSRQVLNEISFDLHRGEIVGLLGPNGAGKSTTMRILSGCLSPDRGSVAVLGFDLSKAPAAARSRIGYLPEDNPLYDELYVSEYLEYVAGLYPHPGQVRERVREAVIRTGLLSETGRKIGRLSKGYRQRVGLAQAIIHEPELLILDEPLSGLDPNQIEELNRLLLELGKEKTVLLSSHVLAAIEPVCSRVMIISDGYLRTDQPMQAIDDLPGLFKEITRL